MLVPGLHLYSAPSRSMRRRGKALAQDTSALWTSRPKTKGWFGRGRPWSDWKVERTYRKPACSSLPRKRLPNRDSDRCFTTFPTEIQKKRTDQCHYSRKNTCKCIEAIFQFYVRFPKEAIFNINIQHHYKRSTQACCCVWPWPVRVSLYSWMKWLKMSFGKLFSSGRHCSSTTTSTWPTACIPFVVMHQHFLLTSVTQKRQSQGSPRTVSFKQNIKYEIQKREAECRN